MNGGNSIRFAAVNPQDPTLDGEALFDVTHDAVRFRRSYR